MKKLLIPVLLVFIFFSSCNQWKYVGEYDHEVDFSSYKTFGLLNWEKQNDKQVSPQTKEFMLMAIKREMEKRGYTYQKENADLRISVYIVINEETSYSGYLNHYAGYSGYAHIGVGVGVDAGGTTVGAYGYGMPTYPYTIVKHDHDVGAVVIDLLDHSKKKMIWQGFATGDMAHEEPTEAGVGKGVARIFKTLPVKKVK